MPALPKSHGLNSFQTNCVETIIHLKPPLFRKEAVFIELFKVDFRKVNLPIDNPKKVL